MYDDKVLLVTGGTGSFGRAVLRRFINDFREIRIFSRDEKKQDDMRHELRNPKVKFYIGDVRDRQSVDGAMVGVDYVFAAAALKQVPSCEFFPLQAVYTNILGTGNVLESAIAHGVSNVVVLSTDKAAYPISAMGMSKALMEKTVIARGRSLGRGAKTTICCTRFGNVMATRGSVIPLFVDQLREGRRLTVTDPGMTRFMMSLDDAVDLVFFALEHGENGDLFVRKSPAASIGTLARAVLEVVGGEGDASRIQVVGARPGEKKHETLVTREEMARAVDLGDYFRIPADGREQLEVSPSTSNAVKEVGDYNSISAERLDVAGMKRLLLGLSILNEGTHSR